MKYGRLIYQYTGQTYIDDSAIFNIGDNIQTFAIDNIYKAMGIPQEDIIDINFCEMKNYAGEYVIVPMAGYASHYKRFNQLPPSSHIIPFFISFEMSDETCDDIIPYLKQHEPIGCRDEATMQLLRRKGVAAYTSGCLTITLPPRRIEPAKKKVFFVDVPSGLLPYIPEELKQNSEFVNHEGTVGCTPVTEERCKQIDLYAREVIERYRDEASLVVTSRLHAASPCVAMGIPVVLAIDNIDLRFSWLDKLIPIYDSKHYNSINWSPQPVNIENLKQKIVNMVCRNLKRMWEENADCYDISSFWENRERATYNAKLYSRLSFLKEKHKNTDVIEYVIWGAGVHGKLAYTLMCESFPNAGLVAIVDNYMDGTMFGKAIVKPGQVKTMHFDYALITTHLGRVEAVDILNSMKKKKHEDWCYFISKDIPEDVDEVQ